MSQSSPGTLQTCPDILFLWAELVVAEVDLELFVTNHLLKVDGLIGEVREVVLRQKVLEVDLEKEDPLYQLEN